MGQAAKTVDPKVHFPKRDSIVSLTRYPAPPKCLRHSNIKCPVFNAVCYVNSVLSEDQARQLS